MTRAAFDGWMPVRVAWAHGQPQVDWCWLDRERFTDPFFEQTITRALRDPARLVFRRLTPMAQLELFADASEGVPPTGFIFHLSRCGSTLIAQMLAALARNIVISEAPPIDELLAVHLRDPRITRDQQVAWLRGLIHVFGRRRTGSERNYFIKCDSWHVFDLSLICEAFPDVPWIFVYRDPVEVMVSQQRQRGTHMIPGIIDPRRFGFEPAAAAQMSLDEYCASVLARICAAVLPYARLEQCRLVNFSELPRVLWESLDGFFGVEWTPGEVTQMLRAAQSDAKTPALPHVDDRAEKQRDASEALRRLVATTVGGYYADLEALRFKSTLRDRGQLH